MPSLPTSLILVGLVVAWLVVLVPMVAKRRERVPENHEDGASFRVLHRDSMRRRRRPVLSRTAMARADADDADAAGDDVPLDELDEDAAFEEDDAFDEDGAFDERAGAVGEVRAGDGVDDDADVAEVESEYDVVSADSRADEDAPTGAREGTRVGAAMRVSEEHDPGEVLDAADDWQQEHQREWAPRAEPEVREPSWRREPRVDRRAMSRGVREAESRERPVEEPVVYRTAPVRPGRGGFDPRAAERARAARFRQRRRIVLILAALMVAGVPVGLLGTGYGWVGTAVAGVLLVLYLAYLRRQVRIEDAIRQRRAARLARAQQIRPSYRPSVAEQVYAHRTGGAPRVDEAPLEPEYRVRSHARPTVPPSSYRRGTPVDLEDSDPAFDDLEYYRPAAYRRRAG